MSLINQLQRSRKGSQTVTEFLFQVKRIADELAVLDAAISDDDITLYVLNGLGSEYRDITASICTTERSFTFEELHSHLIAHEEFLQKEDAPADVAFPTKKFPSVKWISKFLWARCFSSRRTSCIKPKYESFSSRFIALDAVIPTTPKCLK